jgi:TatD family hydrolase
MDGVCYEYLQAPNSMARGILSRIKIMAGLDIAEKRLPQDGKIKFRRKGIPPFELRVATLPTTGGFEDVVLRILANAGAMKIDEMGLNERNLKLMKEIISQPYGLVLVVGPTGSGKTTSLHAALGHINKPGIKIWTAEDPVEITQLGMRQVEAKPKIGLDFAHGADRNAQADIFTAQLETAAELNLPVMLHIRSAFGAALEILRSFRGRITGTVHGFSRGPELALQFAELGFYISFGGAVTSEKFKKALKAAAAVPLNRILLETDAPSAGLKNVPQGDSEPAHIRDIALAVARLKGVSAEQISEITEKNINHLFRLG